MELFRKNKIFDLDQKKIFAELNRNEIRLNDAPNRENAQSFGAIFGMSEKSITERQNG